MVSKVKFNFNTSYQDLQKIVAWFEKEEFDLEEGIEKFKEGTRLVKELKAYLDTMENTISELRK